MKKIRIALVVVLVLLVAAIAATTAMAAGPPHPCPGDCNVGNNPPASFFPIPVPPQFRQ